MHKSITTFADLPISQSRLDEYVDCWSIEETRGAALAERILSTDPLEHLRQLDERRIAKQGVEDEEPMYGVVRMLENGIAVIEMNGTLMKQDSSFGGTSTVRAKRSIRQAVADPQVRGIMLVFDSPGGSASGCSDLCDAVAAAAKQKIVHGYAEDCCCSAAYAPASQTSRLSGNRNAVVGAIGTYTVVRDVSGKFAADGIKTHVVKAGQFKGLGVPGAEVTGEQLAETQRMVDGLNQEFVDTVERGRKFTKEKAAQLADGRVYVGRQAVEVGLMDAVGTFEEALSALTAKIEQTNKGRKTAMSATVQDIKAACVGASSEFVVSQLEKGATIEEAKSAFIVAQGEAVKAANERAKQAEDEAVAAKQKTPGVTAPNETVKPPKQDDGTSAAAQFKEAVAAKMNGPEKLSKQDATKAVCKEQPELQAAMLNEVNAQSHRPANFAA